MRYVRALDQDLSAHIVGGKAEHLARLARHVTLPPGCVVDARALSAFVERNFSVEQWERLLHAYRTGQRGPLFAELAHSPLPPRLLDQVAAGAPPGDVLIVRSSAVQEDRAGQSLAGHFESVLTSRDDLPLALKKCWLVGLRVLLDQLEGPDAERGICDPLRSLALVIQPVVPSVVSGVYFTHAPLEAGCSLLVANWGTCHSVVDGSLPTDLWRLRGDRIEEERPRFKFEMCLVDPAERWPGETVPSPLGPVAIHQPREPHLYVARVPPGLDSQRCLGAHHVAEIVQTGRKLQALLGRRLDIEWSFADGRLHVLQARPITTRPSRRRPAAAGDYRIASTGRARGPVRIVSSPRQRIAQGDIMAVVATDPDYMPMLYRAGAVLSEEGSPLSHTAIVARELKIPCLLGVRLDDLREGEVITVDAWNGCLRRDDAHIAAPPPPVTPTAFYRLEHLPRGRAEVTVAASALALAGLSPAQVAARYDIGQVQVLEDLL